jgi:hypothetical protein
MASAYSTGCSRRPAVTYRNLELPLDASIGAPDVRNAPGPTIAPMRPPPALASHESGTRGAPATRLREQRSWKTRPYRVSKQQTGWRSGHGTKTSCHERCDRSRTMRGAL